MINNSKIFGYARISSADQNLARQIEAFKEFKIDERDIFLDKQSGKDFDREQYLLLKKILRRGDTLVIKELDRLGRDMDGIKAEWNYFSENGININILDMPILNTTDKSDLEKRLIMEIVLSLLSYLAEKERLKILQRQMEGIAIAKSNGIYKGRKRKELVDFNSIYSRWRDGEITAVQACKELGISSPTFYRRVKEIQSVKI
ncbi:MAG: recombinase family protein [Candidatus Moranbacteria bacterium]|nr:recombinase family protein [Candidatus Moranbacteria bacterium]